MALNMNALALLFVFGSFAIYLTSSHGGHGHSHGGHGHSHDHDHMHTDMYCIGCELTIKVAEKVLKDAPKDQVASFVSETLENICKPDNFKISEFSKDDLTDSCKRLISEHKPALEKAMTAHYSLDSPPSYLDLAGQVCHDLTNICHGDHHDHDHDHLEDDAKIHFDRDANDFVVLPGKNLKVAKPVIKGHEEL